MPTVQRYRLVVDYTSADDWSVAPVPGERPGHAVTEMRVAEVLEQVVSLLRDDHLPARPKVLYDEPIVAHPDGRN